MSRVLLAYPNESRILEHFGDRAPLNILYPAAYMRKQGHEVKVWDGNHQSKRELIKNLKNFEPHYVGISIYTSPILNESLELSSLVRINYPKIKLIAGGYHASIAGFNIPGFDYICVGEGERILEEIKNHPLSNILFPPKVENIDDIPVPARDLVNMNWYNMKQNGKRTATLISSRGCPYNCIFCGNINHRVRFHSPKRVEEEVKELIDKYGFKSFYFLDDLFTANKKRVLDVADRLNPLNISYRITTRANLLDEDIVKALADSGCEIVSMGIESASDKVLKSMSKKMTIGDNEKAIRLCHKYRIDVKGFFMFGGPEETKEDAERTIQWAKKWKHKGLVSADFYYLTPFPGSPIWYNPEKYGIQIINKNYNQYLQIGKTAKPKIRTKYLDENDLENLVKKAKEEFEKW